MVVLSSKFMGSGLQNIGNNAMKYMPLQFKMELAQQPTAMKITKVHH